MTFVYQDGSKGSVLNIVDNNDKVITSPIPENHVIIGIEGKIEIPSNDDWRRIS